MTGALPGIALITRCSSTEPPTGALALSRPRRDPRPPVRIIAVQLATHLTIELSKGSDMAELTHLDAAGKARMVDVADRSITTRTATASGVVRTAAAALIAAGSVPKGDVLATARIAGIMAAKRTPDLIPLCHPIAVHGVSVDLQVVDDQVRITATVRTADRTGVEMEALTAVAVAGLTVIDMIKAVDPGASLTEVAVDAKDGGRNGRWQR